jgi:excisionase family DNA binding protein
LAEIISSDVALLVTFNQAIDGVIQNNPKARANPKALAQLDGYKKEQQQNIRLLTAEDIAAMLSVKVQTVYTMARRGELEKVKLSRKCLRFRADDVERFIERKAGLTL